MAATSDSGSDHDSPNQEPEFHIHAMDEATSHRRPPRAVPPIRQQMPPPAAFAVIHPSRPATTMADAVDSDSGSDQDCPDQEPEFVLHVVDDQPRPPPRRPIQYLPPAPLPQPQFVNNDRLWIKHMILFLLRMVHFVGMMVLTVTTVALAAQLPKEFTESYAGQYRIWAPVVMGINISSWFLVGLLNNDHACNWCLNPT